MNELLEELGMTRSEAKNFAERLYIMANADINTVDEKLIDQSAELLDTFQIMTGVDF